MPRITPGGLRVENFTCYDGDDLFQAICLFEKGLFPGSRPVLSAWPVDGTVVLRHAGIGSVCLTTWWRARASSGAKSSPFEERASTAGS